MNNLNHRPRRRSNALNVFMYLMAIIMVGMGACSIADGLAGKSKVNVNSKGRIVTTPTEQVEQGAIALGIGIALIIVVTWQLRVNNRKEREGIR